MSTESVIDFYEALGFEETEIEDNLTAFVFDFDDGSYGLLTDEDGVLPETLKQRLIFALYTSEGAFQWSTSFKNSYTFQDLWNSAQSEQKLEILEQYKQLKA